MRDIRNLKCQTCGGQIIINEEKRICSCESCGNDFDYDYLFDKDLLSSAMKALAIKEYRSANKMFDFYLMENPDSREAFVGKVMSSCNVSSVEEMNVTTMSKSLLTADFSNYRDVSGEDAAIVKLCNEAMQNARIVSSSNNKSNGFDSNMEKLSNKIKDLEEAECENYVQIKDGNTEEPGRYIRSTIIVDAIIVGIGFLAILIVSPEYFYLGFILLGFCAVLTYLKLMVTGAFSKYKKQKEIEAEIDSIRNEIAEIRKNKTMMLDEANKASKELARNIKDIRKWAMS